MEIQEGIEIQSEHVKDRMAETRNFESSTVELECLGLKAGFGKNQVLKGINLQMREKSITAIMGPSGCGKTTFIRCLNRLHELTPGATVEGEVRLDGVNIYSREVDAVAVRRKIGMVFQKPNPFPTMSVYDNVVAGLKLNGVKDRKRLDGVVEKSLKMAFLWDEVKDELKEIRVSTFWRRSNSDSALPAR